MSIKCTTPLLACTSTAIILLFLLFPSVRVAPPVTFAVIGPPKVFNSKLSDKSPDNALVSAITWYVNVAFKVGSSIDESLETPNSTSKSLKALLLGAKTVNGAGEVPGAVLKIDGKSAVKSPLVRADSKLDKFSSATAKVTIDGIGITPVSYTPLTLPTKA